MNDQGTAGGSPTVGSPDALTLVLHRDNFGRAQRTQTFWSTGEVDGGRYAPYLTLPQAQWRAMGEPDTLTITVEPS